MSVIEREYGKPCPHCKGPTYIDAAGYERCCAMHGVPGPPSEVESLRQRLEGAVEALRKIERLQAKWGAPVTSDDIAASNRAWAPVGSEAVKIARDALRWQ